MARTNRNMTMALNRLLELKQLKQELEQDLKDTEKQIKEQEAKLLHFPTPPEKHTGEIGTLSLITRKNHKIPDNIKLIEQSSITTSIFVQNAKMEPSKVNKLLGKEEYDLLLINGVIMDKGDTKYYKFEAGAK